MGKGEQLQLERGKISGPELTFLLAGFLFGSSVLITPAEAGEHQAWLAILLGMGEGLAFAVIYLFVLRKFPNKTLVEICEVVFGRLIGKTVAIIFLMYLFYLAATVATNFHDFLKMAILVNTPSFIFILVGLGYCSYGAKNGIEVLARTAQGMVILTIGLFLLTLVLILAKIKFTNFLPLFVIPTSQMLWGIHQAATFPFGESVAFMMIIPFLNKQKDSMKSVFKGFIMSCLVFLLIAVRMTGVLGETAKLLIYPSYYVTRLINVADVFTRLEIITATNFLVTGFIKIAVLLYATSLGVAQVFELKDYKVLVLPFGLLAGLIGITNFSSVTENIKFANEVYPLFALPFQVGIPLLILLVTIIRKLPKKGK